MKMKKTGFRAFCNCRHCKRNTVMEQFVSVRQHSISYFLCTDCGGKTNVSNLSEDCKKVIEAKNPKYTRGVFDNGQRKKQRTKHKGLKPKRTKFRKGDDMDNQEKIVLENSIGKDILISGYLTCKHAYFDKEKNENVRQFFYTTKGNKRACCVITKRQKTTEKRAYLITQKGELFTIYNGLFEVTFKTDQITSVMQGLCGKLHGFNLKHFLGIADSTKERKRTK